ncbi:hypothetical protein RND81_08G206100 [Saponaria officinalis]|uniref:F-box domain-containing protein n=1 Tax=Saponaria officinalis TaxID=3572 RepID=A0AAW1JBE8_SAPOF
MEEEQNEPPQTTTTTTTNKITIKIPTHKTTTNAGILPLDPLLQIWSHLPATSLYRLRSVCHLWNSSIISDPLLPSFRHRLRHRLPPSPTLLLILRHLPSEPIKVPDRPALLSTVPASDLFLSSAAAAVPSHHLKNGFTPYADTAVFLLPSSHRLSPLCCFASNRFFYLCNPSINRFLRISPSQTRHSTTNAAFGYLPIENRFALVNITDTTAEILEFGPGQAGSATWRVIPDRAPGPVRDFGLMVNKRFFWASAELGLGFSICLDYTKEEFTIINPPQGNAGETMMYDKMYLVEFRGAVCAVDNFSRPPRMQVWVLDEVGNDFNWVRKYNVFMTGMSRDVVYPFCDYYFYDENEEDEVKRREKSEMIVLCNKTRSRLYCYNTKSRNTKLVYKPKQRSFEQLALYTPGLFPLSFVD